MFLEHTYRWLRPGGVLVFVIPQPRLKPCARVLSEHFNNLSVLFTSKTRIPPPVSFPETLQSIVVP